MRLRSFTFLLLLLGTPLLAAKVELRERPSGRWELLREGEPFPIRGIGRRTNLELAAAIGANTVRTYGSRRTRAGRETDLAFLAEAERHGLAVIVGIKLFREGKNFQYSNPEHLERQREHVRATVRALRESPALLLWGLGNETEGPRSKSADPALWKELEVLAKIIREEDPDHPIMVAIAGPSAWRLGAAREFCPTVDILGINAYGEAAGIAQPLDEGGWEKPFILTEFGPRGHWEVPFTPWKAPLEPTSREKAEQYTRGYLGAKGDPKGRFIGAITFAWGHKQEITGTWYGMFLSTGEKTPAVDVMARLYSGRWPANRSPQISSLASPLAGAKATPETDFTATVEAEDPEDDPLSIEWKMVRESGVDWAEGNREPRPPTVPDAITPTGPDGRTATIRTPARPGGYRVFVFIRDGAGGGATQNFPFYVPEP